MMKTIYMFLTYFVFFNQFIFSQSSWISFTAYHSRHINDVYVNDFNHVCMVGGHPFNDSICSIYLSNDAGATWNIILDNITTWARSVVFTSQQIGFIVGDHGKILKTIDSGYNWINIPVQPDLKAIDFYSIFFWQNVGFISGGSETLNKKVILKSNDNGNTWNIVLQENGKPLKKIFFVNENIGYCVGSEGDIYKTIDNGNTWIKLIIPMQVANRDFNSLYFLNENLGFIVGGRKTSNDSLQTILKTQNGGQTWTIVKEELSPILNDIQFISMNTAYAVGNNGVVLFSNDGGNTWNTISLPNNSINYKFNAIHFLNPYYGYIVGDAGIVYQYYNPIGQAPVVQTLTPCDLNTDTITLRAIVNPNGFSTNVYFEYGYDENYGNTINPYPANYNGNNDIEVRARLFPLQPNTIYHYRIRAENTMGVNYGEDKQFYSGNPIPNYSFEYWDTLNFDFPIYYNLSSNSIKKSTLSHSGNYALYLKNDTVNQVPGFISLGETNDGIDFWNGASLQSQPDSIVFYSRHEVENGDSLTLLLIFKKQGTIISNNLFKITGSTQHQYKRFSFPISYISQEIPDTFIIAFISANYPNLSYISNLNEWYIDDISFIGTLDTIPNAGFEYWKNIYFPILENWRYNIYKIKNDDSQNIICPSTYYHYGKKSLQISNLTNNLDTIFVKIISNKNPIYYRPKSLTGYYYNPYNNIDSFFIFIWFYKNTNIIGESFFYLNELNNSFTPFETPIIYYTQTETPDSFCIEISSKHSHLISNLPIYIDDLNFDSFLIHVDSDKIESETCIYPNPASDYLHILLPENVENKNIKIYDLHGTNVINYPITNKEKSIQLNLSNLNSGIYIVQIITNKKNIFSKIIINKN